MYCTYSRSGMHLGRLGSPSVRTRYLLACTIIELHSMVNFVYILLYKYSQPWDRTIHLRVSGVLNDSGRHSRPLVTYVPTYLQVPVPEHA
jgi:hypothetical protein